MAAPAITFAELGSGAGQVDAPQSVAVDQSTGTVYVAEWNNSRISEFESSGHFLMAFGRGVLDGAEELQSCTTTCNQGIFDRSSPDSPTHPENVAVDNDPSSLSYHDVYVAGESRLAVQEFTPSGKFLLEFGKGVDGGGGFPSHPGNLCTAEYIANGDKCGAGSSGSGAGEFSYQVREANGLPLAVDGSGNVWVGDVNRIEEFNSEGAYLSEIALPGAGDVESLAIDSAGDFYLKSSAVAGVQKLEPSGTPFAGPYPLDASGNPNTIALDPATGSIFVSDQFEPGPTVNYGKATLLEFDSSGAQTEAFGAGEVIGDPMGNALAFGDTAGSLYVVSNAPEQSSAAQIFAAPAPGPLVRFGATKATEIAKTAATLGATINPEHAETTYHFQYITEAQFMADGNSFGAGALATPESASIGEDFAYRPVSFAIGAGQLTPATVYRFRVVATNSNAPSGIDGETASFETLPPARIESTSVTEVTSTSAVLQAEVNPLGDATSYHFEYLTEAEFQANGESWVGPDQPTLVPVPDAAIGAGVAGVAVSQYPQGLRAGTVYRYRVVAVNALALAGFAGPDRTFTTQTVGGSLALPDGRRWEMVSPPEKYGALIDAIGIATQASVSGDAFAFKATAPTEAEPLGYAAAVNVLSARGPEGWRSRDIGIPHKSATGITNGEYSLFSEDLSLGLVQPKGGFTPFAADASEQTPYIGSDFSSSSSSSSGAFCTEACYRPLVTGCPSLGEECKPAVQEHANVPPGTKFGTCAENGLQCAPEVLNASSDLSHVVLVSEHAALIKGAPIRSLYEWSAQSGGLSLVSVLPNEIPDSGSLNLGIGRHVISTDGSRIVWADVTEGQHLYLRDMAREKTVQLDAVQGGTGSGAATAHIQTASSDGSRVFFTDNQHLTADSGGVGTSSDEGDLYECEILEGAGGKLECRLTDLTPVNSSAEPARVRGFVVGASEDGSYVYFVADAKLAEGAEKSTCQGFYEKSTVLCNLYVSHDGVTSLIARLSEADSPDWSDNSRGLSKLVARVSPDGRYLAFMSQRSLTGYDNRDARTGLPDEEVYLYHAAAGEDEKGALVCASCDPTGARPLGVEYGKLTEENLDGVDIWPPSRDLAASLPAWSTRSVSVSAELTPYQSRYLSNSGRLFFNSPDALVPQDTNGTGDVYEYEPPKSAEEAPASDTCTTESSTYSPSSGGCVNLISSGTAAEEAGFLDASENGDDVFFFTDAKLSPRDFDSARDVYDAHVCGASAPCPPPPPPPLPACVGDACQSPVQAPNDATPGSLTFNGPGNVVPPASTPAVKPKSLTRAQKLAQALKACRKKSKRKRLPCEKQARRTYGPVGKAKKSAKGRK